ncbi:MAG: polysaccharide biosynthesis/export family protein [Desulfobulbaceae bacterium]|jgi:polysaccharide export outer membrane protein|nr:polysaccharide export protein [Desulfobulbaceae bacterium]MDY0352064.1 polysaccharide biosynthesis/export family protein [Desulfobulbaceae bacterium]
MYGKLALFVLVVILGAGCARQQLQPNVSLEDFDHGFAAAEQSDNAEMAAGMFAQAQPAPLNDDITDYVLGAGDLISVTVFEASELNTESRISSRGVITMPLLGQIHLQGLTTMEAEEKIEQALIKDYMHDANVTLFVKERVSQQITLVGAVAKPGTYETKVTKRLLEVLSMAGGLTRAAGDTVYVTRHRRGGEGNEVFLVDMEKLLEEGRVETNMYIRGGDVIFVPQSDIVQVEGAVWQPGPVRIDGSLTIDEAIAAAGGLAQYADEDDIKLIRKDKGGKRQIIQLSMAEILAMKKEKNADIETGPWRQLLLKNGDVIFAEASGMRSFYSGVGFSIGFMGTGVQYRNPVQYRAPSASPRPAE